MAEKQLTRCRDAWVAGVCGGLADYFGLQRNAFRIIWLILTLFTAGFPGLLLYLLLWLVMPQK